MDRINDNDATRLAIVIRTIYEEAICTDVSASAGAYDLRRQQQHEVGLAAVAVFGRLLGSSAPDQAHKVMREYFTSIDDDGNGSEDGDDDER